MRRPLISVVIPTYNAAAFIEKCLTSVVHQNYKNFEIIVVDDCSNDNTSQEIKKLKIKNLRFFKTKKNSGGPAKPRNLGIYKSKGMYIAFLDQDDHWEKNKLKICINAIKNKYDLCYHQLKTNNKVITKHKIDISEDPFQMLLRFGPIPTTSGIVCKKRIIKKVNGFSESKNLVAGEDYDCWLKIAKAGGKFFFINKPLGTYGKNFKRLTNPKRGIKIIREIKKKYFKNEQYIPFWMHKSLLKSICYTKGFHHSVFYGLKNIKDITVSFISLLKKA